MRLISWNVNGIRAAVKKGFVSWVNNDSADIICLQEVKATREQGILALGKLNNYSVFWNDTQSRAGYSGVATLSKKEPLKTENGLGIEEFDREGRILIHEYEDFFLYNIYFPNSQREHERLDYKLRFYDTFLEHANQSRKSGKAILVCGDFNTAHKEIDLTYPKANKNNAGFLPEEREWMDKFVSQGYSDTFRLFTAESSHHTWWTYRLNARQRNIGWRLDYFFIDQEHKDLIKNAFILKEIMGSDHCPAGITLSLKK